MNKQAITGMAALATLYLGMPVLRAADNKVIWLDEMNLSQAVSGWGETQAKKTVANKPLTLRGKAYERGIGTHAPGALRIDLDKRALRFKAIAGVADEVGKQGSVEFIVMGDKAPTPTAAPKLGRPRNPPPDRWPAADQVFDKSSLPDPADKDEADAVLRRVGALITHLKTLPRCPDLKQAGQRLAALKTQAGSSEAGNAKRGELLAGACKLRRKVAFANPLLDFNRILFIKRHFCPNEEVTGNHRCDPYFGFNAIRGGGLCVLENPFSDAPTVRNILEKSVCENGRYKGQSFTSKDGFLAPELSFDGKEVLFARTEIADNEADRKRYAGQGSENNTYKIFRFRLDGGGLMLDCLPWSYPGWIPNPWSQEAADWFVAFLDVAKKQYGLKIDWVAAAWNEKGCDLNWIVKTLRPAMDAHGYADVKLQAPDNNGSWQIFDDLARNPEADKVIQAVGYHYPNEFGPLIEAEGKHAAEKVIATGKPLWSSEEFCYSGQTWEMAMLLAQVYNKNYIRSRMTKTEVWPMLCGMYPGLAFHGAGLMLADTPWSGNYDVYPAVWTTAHTTQFTESGWRYMDKACGKIATNPWKGSYVALRDPKNGDWSLIVCTDKPTNIHVQVTGKLAKGDVHVWKSNGKIQFIEEKPLRLTNGTVTISLEGNSIYTLSTTTVQKKGAHPPPPPAAAFPLPYLDDFESYAAGAIAKYTTDMKGSFEAANCFDDVSVTP